MITAVLFDWGGVFNPQHESLAGYHAVAQRYGHTPERLYDVLYSGDEWRTARIGGMTSEAYWRTMQAKLGVNGTLDTFLADLFAGNTIDPELIVIAEQVHVRYRTGLLSNALDDLEQQLADACVDHLFDVVINSARVGVAKPDPRAFELALEALATPAEEVLFIDDKWRNVVAARAMRIPTIHYTTPAALREELKQYLDLGEIGIRD